MRGCEVAPHTGLQWLGATAEHLTAFSQDCLHDIRVTQGQLAERYARLRAVTEGEVSAAEALTRLSRSPPGGWAVIDPGPKLLLPVDVGDPTRAMAQRGGHQVGPVRAPAGVPLCLPDGCTESAPALLTHADQ